MPEVREFMAWMIVGQTQSMIVHRMNAAMGSARDELHLLDFTKLQMSATDLLKLTALGRECTGVLIRLQNGMIKTRIFFQQRLTIKAECGRLSAGDT